MRQYCYICGNTTLKKGRELYHCNNCQQNYYDNPRPCADLFLFNDEGKVLVARRKHDPSKGMLDIPGGFLDFDETFEQAAMREIEEELGLVPDDYSKPLYFTSYFTNYPWGKENYQTVVTAFAARLKPDARPQAKDDVEEIFFAEIAQIKRQEFGFPPQADCILLAAKVLEL